MTGVRPVEFEAADAGQGSGWLSSHADQPGLLEYAGRMRPKHIVLGSRGGERTEGVAVSFAASPSEIRKSSVAHQNSR